jgi:hypothetical protein
MDLSFDARNVGGQTENGKGRHGLAAAGLPDETDDLSEPDA